MDRKYSIEDLDVVLDRVHGWGVKFSKCRYYDDLTEDEKDCSESIVMTFTEFMLKYLDLPPDDWDEPGLEECCVQLFPSKVVGDDIFFKSISPVLNSFFIYLANLGLLSNASTLAEKVSELNEQIIDASAESSNWGFTKRFAMHAKDVGVDISDNEKMSKLMLLYDLYHKAKLEGVDVTDKKNLNNYLIDQFTGLNENMMAHEKTQRKKVSRNESCPCGSGKKYKKCCLNKDKNDNKEVKDLDIACDKYIKDIKEYLSDLWDEDKLRNMSTKEIIKKLRLMGITFDEETFKEQTKEFNSAIELSEKKYYTQVSKFKGMDEDFIWLAMIVLWERLCPKQINIEMLNDAIQDGFISLKDNNYKEVMKYWALAWKMLKKLVPQKITSIEEAEEFFSGKMSQLIIPWCENYELESANAGMDKSIYFKDRIEFCREFIDKFPESKETIMVNMHRAVAESYFALDDSETAERLYQELIEKYPANAWGYIGWGDMYFSPLTKKKVTLDLDRAEEIYNMGLSQAGDDIEMLNERLTELEELRDMDFD